ncbi:hypothetical protein ABZP36_021517 [Zizania latifolia]
MSLSGTPEWDINQPWCSWTWLASRTAPRWCCSRTLPRRPSTSSTSARTARPSKPSSPYPASAPMSLALPSTEEMETQYTGIPPPTNMSADALAPAPCSIDSGATAACSAGSWWWLSSPVLVGGGHEELKDGEDDVVGEQHCNY